MNLQINNLKIDLVFLLVFLCPIFFLGNHLAPDFSDQQILCMQFMAALMLAASMSNKWLGGFLLLTLSHLFLFKNNTGWLTYTIPLFFGCLLYELIKTRYFGNSYRYAILGVLVFNLIIAFFQAVHYPIFSQQQYEVCGWLRLPSFMGIFCAITAPVIMSISPWLIILSLIGVLLSKSAFACLAFAIGIGFYVWFVYPKFRTFLWPVFIFFSVMTPFLVKKGFSGQEMSRRLHVWPMVASRAFRSPFVGYGAGNGGNALFIEMGKGDEKHVYFSVALKPENEIFLQNKILQIAQIERIRPESLQRLQDVHFKLPGGVLSVPNLNAAFDELRGQGLGGWIWSHCHNEYLQVWLDFGFVGLFLMGGFIVDIFRRFFIDLHLFQKIYVKKRNDLVALMAGFIATLIMGMAHFEFYLVPTVIIIIVQTAILDQNLRGIKDDETWE